MDSKQVNSEFIKACIEGNKDTVMLMLDKGATKFRIGRIYADKYGHSEIAGLMHNKEFKVLKK